MNPVFIRGNGLRPQEPQNITRRRVLRSNDAAQGSSSTLNRDQQVLSRKHSSTQSNLSKRLPKMPLTIAEVAESLENWEDPMNEKNSAQDSEAKKRIEDCFTQHSNTLDLSSLNLSTIPDVLGRYDFLQYLSIANNVFTEIPEGLTSLTDLKNLNVSNNILKEVPDTIKAFQKLEFFNAESNQLEKVSEELGRLPRIRKVILAHNRILKFPKNIYRIKNLVIDDQVPFASFENFSKNFADRWENTYKDEPASGFLELWLARFEEILRLPRAAQYRKDFTKRIGTLLDAMIDTPSLREICYRKAQSVISTCYDGILFALFEMEVLQIEETLVHLPLSDVDIRRLIEQVYNFYRLQQLAILYVTEVLHNNPASQEKHIILALETMLFFYVSNANNLDMPMDGERLRFMRNPEIVQATDNDVKRVVHKIQREKEEHGEEFLIDFALQKEFWQNYLSIKHANIIEEHTDVFMCELEELENKKHEISEFDYLEKVNGMRDNKNDSETRLFRQLTRNILDINT